MSIIHVFDRLIRDQTDIWTRDNSEIHHLVIIIFSQNDTMVENTIHEFRKLTGLEIIVWLDQLGQWWEMIVWQNKGVFKSKQNYHWECNSWV